MPDDQADTYGKGYLSGTIIGIASTSEKQNAAWELVKYLTTDTDAVVSFANAIHNVPSTLDALKSPDLDQSRGDKTFIEIAQNPDSNTTPASPNGGAYQVTLQDLGYDYESGKVDRPAGRPRRSRRADRHGHRPGAVSSGSTRRPSSGCARGADANSLRNLAFLSPWLLGTGLFFLYPLVSTVYFSFTKYDGFTPAGLQRARQLDVRLRRTTRSSGRRCATRCGWSS